MKFLRAVSFFFFTFSVISFVGIFRQKPIINASGAEVEVQTEYVENILVDGVTVVSNKLTKEAYEWNVESEIDMRMKNPSRAIGDSYEIEQQSMEILSTICDNSEVSPAYIVIPALPVINILGYDVSTEEGITHYLYAKVTFSSQNGGARGYYSFNGSNFIQFFSGNIFFIPGTYVFHIYDNGDFDIEKTIVIDDFSREYNGTYNQYLEVTPVPENGFSHTAGYELTYSRHFIYVSASSSNGTTFLHSKFIWDVAPTSGYTDYFGVAYDGSVLQLADTASALPSIYSSAEYTMRHNIISVEFDDYHWISGYTTSTLETEYNCLREITISGSQFNYMGSGTMNMEYFAFDLPNSTYCLDEGWGHIPITELHTAEFNIYCVLGFHNSMFNYGNTNGLSFASSYLKTSYNITIDESLSIGVSIDDSGHVSAGISVSIDMDGAFVPESQSFVAINLYNVLH